MSWQKSSDDTSFWCLDGMISERPTEVLGDGTELLRSTPLCGTLHMLHDRHSHNTLAARAESGKGNSSPRGYLVNRKHLRPRNIPHLINRFWWLFLVNSVLLLAQCPRQSMSHEIQFYPPMPDNTVRGAGLVYLHSIEMSLFCASSLAEQVFRGGS
jgi:hypothetical protein